LFPNNFWAAALLPTGSPATYRYYSSATKAQAPNTTGLFGGLAEHSPHFSGTPSGGWPRSSPTPSTQHNRQFHLTNLRRFQRHRRVLAVPFTFPHFGNSGDPLSHNRKAEPMRNRRCLAHRETNTSLTEPSQRLHHSRGMSSAESNFPIR